MIKSNSLNYRATYCENMPSAFNHVTDSFRGREHCLYEIFYDLAHKLSFLMTYVLAQRLTIP